MNARRAFTDKELLQAMRAREKAQGYPASIRELADDLGVRSSETVHGALNRLKKEGKVTWVPYAPRTLKIVRRKKQ